MNEVDKTWHLATTSDELDVTDFEVHLWRLFSGFMHWVEECEQEVNHTDLNGHDLAVLHIIRMKERPKSINDVSRILNRSDIYNMQYTIRKLLKLGLIEKNQHSPGYKKSTTYSITAKGIKNTDQYVDARKKILIEIFVKYRHLNLKEITRKLISLKPMYDEAAQAVSANIDYGKLNDES